MKRSKTLMLLALGVVVGVLAAAGVYFLTVGEVAWQEYVEEKLIPNVVFIATTIGALYVASTPVLTKIKAALENFKKATDGVCATAEKDKALTQEMRTIFSDNTVLYDGLCKMKESLEEDRAEMREGLNKINTVVKIAFCNNRELVEKGFAAEIAKVLADKEAKKEVREDEQSTES
ncbi:MAG: hypothetical protein E7609_05280 [Ruminococcaceae bacterium]|nr:hypothetical protein [Oscillospiraceae bacterium]